MTPLDSPRGTLQLDVRLALDRFDLAAELDIGEGVTGIFGASGAGKSSLLETVAGLRREARGRVALGEDVWLDSAQGIFVPPERRDVGYVPQEGLLFPHWSVRQNLLGGQKRARRGGQQPEEALARVAELLELDPLLERAAPTLSGGERQRVALGRALCSGPRLLLLDEPLAALGLPLRRKLLPFLRRVRDELTVPMLLVSHDPIEVQALCDDLVVLRHGAPIARGAPRQVLTDPAVFPLAERQGYENVLPGRLIRRQDAPDVVRLGGGAGVEIVTLPGPSQAEDDVFLGLSASDILIATERPHGLSARNVLPATVTGISSIAGYYLVTAELGDDVPPVTIEVTEAIPAELGLEAGREVYLVFKAASCRLYGGTPDR